MRKIRRETKFNKKLTKIFIFPRILPVYSSDTLLKTYFKKIVFQCNHSPSVILEMTSSDGIGQKQSAVIEFFILVEEQSINMYNKRLKTSPSQSPSHVFIPKKVALPNKNYYLKQRKCNSRRKKS